MAPSIVPLMRCSCPVPLAEKTPPKHNVSTSMFDGGDGVLGVIGSIPPPPNTAIWVDAKELDFGLICPQHFHPVLLWIIGKLQTGLYMCFLEQGTFRSYLSNREYCVTLGTYTSRRYAISCGVPQGSILGPLLFNLCMLPLAGVINQYNISFHQYADDTQLYFSLAPDAHNSVSTLLDCIESIKLWMSQNFLQLNKDKTEKLVIGNDVRRGSIVSHLDSLSLKTSNQAKNLGIIFDSNLSFKKHVSIVTKTAYLRNISTWHSLPFWQ